MEGNGSEGGLVKWDRATPRFLWLGRGAVHCAVLKQVLWRRIVGYTVSGIHTTHMLRCVLLDVF